ncbi:hypothetical protein HHI36_009409 [Cryptolaemus montrouzieri]|uniref:Uncharacterized protein n=1 Tax=Cryptolaemus montrouzieri TaxID=559131 RepID=A0ABD2MVD7_9CUCU
MSVIKFTVTREDSLHGAQSGVSSTNVASTGDYLTPHVLAPRNSLTSIGECARRRRPITLRIMPRLSLPARSTSAPASTEAEWSAVR